MSLLARITSYSAKPALVGAWGVVTYAELDALIANGGRVSISGPSGALPWSRANQNQNSTQAAAERLKSAKAERDALVKAAGDAVMREAGAGDAPTYRGDPDGREFNESVEDEVDALTCPHCGGKVPRG